MPVTQVGKSKTSLRQVLAVGVDPGASGGIAWKHPQGHMECTPMPEDEDGLELVVGDLERLQAQYDIRYHVFIEQVGAMPGQGVVSMFKFGQNFGMVRQAFCSLPREFVRPQVWVKGLEIPSRSKKEKKNEWKDRLRLKAKQLFPKLSCWEKGLGVQRSLCDALLIAEYGTRKLKKGI